RWLMETAEGYERTWQAAFHNRPDIGRSRFADVVRNRPRVVGPNAGGRLLFEGEFQLLLSCGHLPDFERALDPDSVVVPKMNGEEAGPCSLASTASVCSAFRPRGSRSLFTPAPSP